MPASTQDALGLVVDILLSSEVDDLIIEERTWKTLLPGPKRTLSQELKRRHVPESRIKRCLLALTNDGEQQLAALWIANAKGTDESVVLGDQDRSYGIYKLPLTFQKPKRKRA